MKATMKIKKIAQATIATVAFLMVSAFTPVQAASVNSPAELRLEEAVNSFESAARYVSPAVNENFEDFEVKEAMENLDTLNRQIENAINYQAPSVTE